MLVELIVTEGEPDGVELTLAVTGLPVVELALTDVGNPLLGEEEVEFGNSVSVSVMTIVRTE